MPMPLTNRNIQICQGCTDCDQENECRFIKRNIKFKFAFPSTYYPQPKTTSIPHNRKHFLDLDNIKQRIWNGERSIDISGELGIPHGTFGSILQRHGIKKPENTKYTNDKIRAGYRARFIDKGTIIDKCNRCGKKTKLLRHHPDYSDCYLVEYICSMSHVREHNKDRGREHKPIAREARASRLYMLLKKYGPQTTALFSNFYNFPSIKAIHLAEIANISRERVRQILLQLHGTYKSKETLSQPSAPKEAADDRL